MKNFYLLLSLLVMGETYAQSCNLSISSYDDSVCYNTSTTIIADLEEIQAFEYFNNQMISNGWTLNYTPLYNSSCFNAHPQGLNHIIFTFNSSNPPILISPAITTDYCSNASISFDLTAGYQSEINPCEGPDQMSEGIIVEYSLDFGTTYTLLKYIDPLGTVHNSISTSTSITIGGYQNTPLNIGWLNYTFEVPNSSNNTVTFRISQNSSSGSGFDVYGLANIKLLGTSNCATQGVYNVSWTTGQLNVDTITPTLLQDTYYQAYATNNLGDTVCTSSPLLVNVRQQDSLSVDFYDSAFNVSCYYGTVDIDFASIYDGAPPYSVAFENQSFNDTILLLNLDSLSIDTTNYYNVSVTDMCGSTISDSIEIVYNYPIPNINDIILGINPTLGNYGTVYYLNIPGVSYQWLYCDNNYNPATQPSFNQDSLLFPYPGEFALLVNYNGCVDTTMCFDATMANLEENAFNSIDIYPNPYTNTLSIDHLDMMNIEITLYNILGEKILSKRTKGSKSSQLDTSTLTPGVYLLELLDAQGQQKHVYRLVKQ